MRIAKSENREKLQALANVVGDMFLMEMFWDIFDDLSIKNQEKYLKRAE